MSGLEDLSSAELAEEARRRMAQTQRDDAALGDTLKGLMLTVGEMARRLEAEDG